MGLRVFEDERPGYALLAFTGSLGQPSLSLSVRSLRENAFLGPQGKWQKAPHYFAAERVDADAGVTRFRVGPEIVNHLLEHDLIEVATADGVLREEALWENAVPQMPGQTSGYTIYRPPSADAGGAKPGTAPPPKAPPKVEPQPVADERPHRVETPPAEPKTEAAVVSPPQATRPWWMFVIPLILLVAVGAAAGFPQLRCKLFGMSCNPEPAQEFLGRALACASSKRAAAPCDVEACFNDYFANTPADKVEVKARTTIDEAKNACLKRQAEEADQRKRAEEERVLQAARRCAANSAACAVKTCYAGYLSAYGGAGALRDQARAELARAEKECSPSPPSVDPRAEERRLRSAQQCVEIAPNCSVMKNCYGSYWAEYGERGALREQARAEDARVQEKCASPSPRESPIAEGVYNAAALRGACAPAQFGIRIEVKGNAIAWQHELNGVRYSWAGTVDAQGNIRASVGNSTDFVATGQYSDAEREVRMTYPQCKAGPITLSILGRL